MIELLYFIPMLLVAIGLGDFILGRFVKDTKSIERVGISAVLGMGAIIYITFILGLIGLLYKPIFIGGYVLGVLVFYKRVFQMIMGLWKGKLSGVEYFLVGTLIIFIIMNLVVTMTPVADYDSMLYHLSVPKIYARHHEIGFIPDNPGSVIPEAPQMLYLTGIIIKDGVLAKMYSFTFGLITMLLIYSFVRRFFKTRKGALVIAVLFYTMPMTVISNTIPSTDLAVSLFAFGSFYCFFLWMGNHGRGWLYVSAILSGIAASSKISGIAVPMIILFGVMIETFRVGGKFSRLFFNLFTYGIISFLMMLPFYGRAFLITGNPFYPLFCNIFSCIYWNDIINGLFIASMGDIGLGTGFLTFLLLPWNLTMNTFSYDSLAGIGPIFLAFIPLIFMVKKREEESRLVKYTLLFSFMFILVWFFVSGAHVARYLLPMFTLLVPIMGIVIVQLYKRHRVVISLLLLSLIVFNSAIWFGINGKKFAPALNLRSEEEYLGSLKDNNPFRAFNFANENLPEGSIILLLRETRGYYSDHDYLIGSPHRQGYIDYVEFESYEDFYARLMEIEITHVFVNDGIWSKMGNEVIEFSGNPVFYTKVENLIDDLIENKGKLIYDQEGIRIYELK